MSKQFDEFLGLSSEDNPRDPAGHGHDFYMKLDQSLVVIGTIALLWLTILLKKEIHEKIQEYREGGGEENSDIKDEAKKDQ